jgi:hypothetical protein
MSNVNAVVRTLELAIGRLQQASPDLTEVAVIQAARADIEKVVAGFKVRARFKLPTEHVVTRGRETSVRIAQRERAGDVLA